MGTSWGHRGIRGICMEVDRYRRCSFLAANKFIALRVVSGLLISALIKTCNFKQFRPQKISLALLE
jgi:hypothetical protein